MVMSRRRLRSLLMAVLAAAALLAALLWWRGRASSGKADKVEGGAVASSLGPRAPLRPSTSRPEVHGLPLAGVAGTVRDDQGQSIGGAWVCASSEDPSLSADEQREPHCTTTSPDGSYRIDDVLPVDTSLNAGAPHYIPAVWRDPTTDENNFALVAGQVRTGLDLVLEGGGVELHGVVQDVSGGVVAGALVWVYNGGVGRAISGDDGTFVAWVRPGEVWASAQADGYADGWAPAIAPGETVAILLTPESVISGIVVEAASQRPVVGAEVDIGAAGSVGYSGAVFTDDQGHFRFRQIPPGSYKPEASAQALWGQALESVLVGVGESRTDVVIEVHPAATVRGRVVVAATASAPESPCPSGNASLFSASGLHYTVAITDGAVVFDAVLPGDYAIEVLCTDHPKRDEYPHLLVDAAPVAEQRWEVVGGSRLYGLVVAADGQPVASASMTAMAGGARSRPSWHRAQTKRDGSFEIVGIVDGNYTLQVGAIAQPSLAEPVRVTVAGDTEVRIALPAGGAIEGRVVDQKGRGVGGLRISVDALQDDGGESTRSRDDGSFRIVGLRPGAYRITARRDGEVLRRPGSTDDDVQGERVVVTVAQPGQVRLVVEIADEVIRGRVVDETGAPVTDAFVSAERESDAAGHAAGAARRQGRWSWTSQPALTDLDGRFVIDHLGAGSYTVLAQRRGGGEVAVEKVAPGSDLTLTITPTAVVGGQVELASGGAPTDFTVVVDDRTSGIRRDERFYRSGGAWVMRALPAGTYDVSVRAREGTATLAGITLANGQQRVDLEHVLAQLVTLRGTIVSFTDGTPVAGIAVYSRPVKGVAGGWSLPGETKQVSDEHGRFECAHVTAARLQVRALAIDFQNSPWRSASKIVDATGATGVVDAGEIRILPRRVPHGGRVGDLGFTLVDPPAGVDPADRTWVVASVRVGGPAAAGGLLVGDRLIAIDGHSLVGADPTLYYGLSEVPAGTTITLQVERGATVSIQAGPPL